VLSACIVALGTLISAFWILSANSWMQTPQGYTLQDGVFHPADWTAIVFNPSFPLRFMHMVAAAFLTTAFAVGGIGAWYLLGGRAARRYHGRDGHQPHRLAGAAPADPRRHARPQCA